MLDYVNWYVEIILYHEFIIYNTKEKLLYFLIIFVLK